MTEELVSLQRMQFVSWVLLVILTVGSGMFVSLPFAVSVLVGGIVATGSLWVSYKDVMRMVDSVTALATPEDRQAQARQGQKGYLLRFWIRLAIIGIVLFVLIKSARVNAIGLVLGLSTVVLAITFISLEVVGRYFFRGRR